jgi:hypothetical protein
MTLPIAEARSDLDLPKMLASSYGSVDCHSTQLNANRSGTFAFR